MLVPSGKGADFVIDLVSLDVNPEPEISTMPAPHRAKPEQPVISPALNPPADNKLPAWPHAVELSQVKDGSAARLRGYKQPANKAEAGKIDNLPMRIAAEAKGRQRAITLARHAMQAKGLSRPPLPRPGRRHAARRDANSDTVRLLVRNHLESFKYYPASARRRGIEGQVEVGFTLTRNGAADQVALLHGSGFAVLDHAALDTVHRAQPFPIEDGTYRFRLRFKRL